MITVTAPGKLMLFGEHAVVYGHPCIVSAISQRLTVSVEKIKSQDLTIDAPEVCNTSFVEAAMRLMSKNFKTQKGGFKITTHSSFSGKYGFGSSAAVTVATIRALALFNKVNLTQNDIFDLAYKVVLEVQKVGSGFDVAASTWGGTIFYTKGVPNPENLSAFCQDMPLVIAYSGVKSNSVQIVNEVAQKRQKYPDKVNRIFESIGGIVTEAKTRIMAKDWIRLGKLMDFNQEYLRDLGVSSQKLEDLISAVKKAGAWGAKLSGAGGGDCLIVVVDRGYQPAVEKAIADLGGEAVRASFNAPGVMVSPSDNQNELFIVFDEQDNILGYKTRFECHQDKGLIHRGSDLIIFDEQGRILLQKRSLTKDKSPGLWTVSVTGHVARGESYVQALIRETKEELGITVKPEFKEKFLMQYPSETEMESLYTAVFNGPFKPNPREVEQVEFVSKEELPRKLLSGQIKLTKLAEVCLKKIGYL